MRILEKSPCAFLSNCEIWRVRPDTIDTELQIFIVGPEGSWPEETRFGVTFATDSEQFGNMVPNMVRTLTTFGDVYPSYTVSIGYAPTNAQAYSVQRARDLTPTEWPAYSAFFTEALNEPTVLPTGKALDFLNFIIDELQPELNAAYPINLQDSTLAGHDLGGLFTLFAFLKRPEAFQNYLAISPALWWAESALISLAQDATASTLSPKSKLYLCAGALEAQHPTESLVAALPEDLQAKLPQGILRPDIAGHIHRLEATLAPWKTQGLTLHTATIPNETQGSVIGAGLSQGLRALNSLTEIYGG